MKGGILSTLELQEVLDDVEESEVYSWGTDLEGDFTEMWGDVDWSMNDNITCFDALA